MTPIYLVRHAKAKNRFTWTEPDHLRPLTKAGRRQAEALAAVGESQSFSRLVSSPYLRCVQTFEPLAAKQGLTLETADLLAEGAPIEDALELMLTLAAHGSAAVCTHGDVMMGSVESLIASGTPLEGPLEFKKGAAWILDVTEGRFTKGRYLSPP